MKPLDGLGAFVSASCAVHCIVSAAAPLLLAGIGFLHSERTEWALTAFAALFAILAFAFAWRAKRPKTLLAGFGAGIGLLLGGRFLEHGGVPGAGLVAIGGGVVLVAAHLSHLRLLRACGPAEACATTP